MSSLTDFNGLEVLTPDPTGVGGKAINDNFKKTSTKLATSNPGTSDDAADGFGVGSRWVNTASGSEFVCTDNTNSAAVWLKLIANLTGPITSVGSVTSVASQTGTGSTFVMSASPTITDLVAQQPSAVSMSQTWKNSAGTTVAQFGEFSTGTYGFLAPRYYTNFNNTTGFFGGSTHFLNYLAQTGLGLRLWNINGTVNPTSGDIIGVDLYDSGFVPTSGTATHTKLNIDGSVNQTGGANGITRGLRINPTITAAADWRSLEISPNLGWGIYQSGASAKNYFNGNVGIGISPQAALHLKAGSASASTAPLKFTSGTLLTTAEAGAVEFLSNKFYATITTGSARKELTLNDTALTSGRIPFAESNGRLTDSSSLTFSSGTLAVAGAFSAGTSTLSGNVTILDSDLILRAGGGANNYCKFTFNFSGVDVTLFQSNTLVGSWGWDEYGNITAPGFIGDGAQLTAVTASKVENASFPPGSPSLGQVYFDSTDNHFYGWNGSAWVQLDN